MEQRTKAASPLGRRRFVSVLGGAGLAGVLNGVLAALAPGRALAQAGKTGGTPPATPPAGTPAAGTPPAAPGAPAPPVITEEAKNLLAIVRGRYGAHLTDEQANLLLEALNNTVQAGQALRKKTLANAIEPDVVFRAVPPRQTGTSAREGSGR